MLQRHNALWLHVGATSRVFCDFLRECQALVCNGKLLTVMCISIVWQEVLW
jgi:hypothetical protein